MKIMQVILEHLGKYLEAREELFTAIIALM